MAQYKSALPEVEALSVVEIRTLVNRFLLSKVGSGFAVGIPEQDHSSGLWRVPILFALPDCVLDEVGEARVDGTTGEIQKHTHVAEMQQRATTLYGHHKAQIHTAFLRVLTRESPRALAVG